MNQKIVLIVCDALSDLDNYGNFGAGDEGDFYDDGWLTCPSTVDIPPFGLRQSKLPDIRLIVNQNTSPVWDDDGHNNMLLATMIFVFKIPLQQGNQVPLSLERPWHRH